MTELLVSFWVFLCCLEIQFLEGIVHLFLCFCGITGNFGRAFVCILASYNRAKIPMASVNVPKRDDYVLTVLRIAQKSVNIRSAHGFRTVDETSGCLIIKLVGVDFGVIATLVACLQTEHLNVTVMFF